MFNGFQDTAEKGIVQYFANCARDNGIDGIIDCGTDRVLRSLNTASVKEDVEIFPGVHLTR